jgi:nucleoside phosphorylase
MPPKEPHYFFGDPTNFSGTPLHYSSGVGVDFLPPPHPSVRSTHDDYTVAWICPLEVEQIAAILMLDEQHPRLPQPQTDHNAYTLGSVKGHNIVIAGLPSAGNAPAATVITQITSTFPKLRFGLLMGIGGGVPVKTDDGPVRLSHVVVSKPTGQHSGAV